MTATAKSTTWRPVRFVGVPACGLGSASVRTAGMPAFSAYAAELTGQQSPQIDRGATEKLGHNPVSVSST